MSTLRLPPRCLWIGVLARALLAATAFAQEPASVERISFEVTSAFEPGAAVVGEFRVPESKRDRLPAVLILDSSPGFDGRGAFYSEALNRAGIATLEIDMFQGKGVPATPRHNLPHTYQSLQHLARHPRIDATRIGVMGFSWGGLLSVLTASHELTRQYAGAGTTFAAHLGIYPLCWIQHTILAGKSKHLAPTVYRRVTGRPVHILAGAKDDYDGPDGCRKFVAALPADVRPRFSLTVYRDATFGWDSRFSSAPYERSANQGKGGIVRTIASGEIASQSREFAVAYFREKLGAD